MEQIVYILVVEVCFIVVAKRGLSSEKKPRSILTKWHE